MSFSSMFYANSQAVGHPDREEGGGDPLANVGVHRQNDARRRRNERCVGQSCARGFERASGVRQGQFQTLDPKRIGFGLRVLAQVGQINLGSSNRQLSLAQFRCIPPRP